MKISHISLTAHDAVSLASFYKEVFGFYDKRPPRRLSGELVSRGNGLPNSDICSIWLTLPDSPDPFLEVMQYSTSADQHWPKVDAPGFGHIAIQVPSLAEILAKALLCGGSKQGEITNFGTDLAPILIVYIRDPEGNILELEQIRVKPS